MEKADDHQPSHPPVVDLSGVAARLGPIRDQNHAGAEEHGKDRHEFLVGKHPARNPDELVCAIKVTKGCGIEIRRGGHRKRLDVHHQNAEQREAAHDVNRFDASCLDRGTGVRIDGGAGHVADFHRVS